MTGALDMGTQRIVNVGDPQDGQDVATWAAVLAFMQRLDWQNSVLDRHRTDPPEEPAAGERYIVAAGGTGAWAGHDNAIAEWTGNAWVFTAPSLITFAAVEDEAILVYWTGSVWANWSASAR
jgi:hypothetical protein